MVPCTPMVKRSQYLAHSWSNMVWSCASTVSSRSLNRFHDHEYFTGENREWRGAGLPWEKIADSSQVPGDAARELPGRAGILIDCWAYEWRGKHDA